MRMMLTNPTNLVLAVRAFVVVAAAVGVVVRRHRHPKRRNAFQQTQVRNLHHRLLELVKVGIVTVASNDDAVGSTAYAC